MRNEKKVFLVFFFFLFFFSFVCFQLMDGKNVIYIIYIAIVNATVE